MIIDAGYNFYCVDEGAVIVEEQIEHVSVVLVILVGWATSCWRNLSVVMLISWLHKVAWVW